MNQTLKELTEEERKTDGHTHQCHVCNKEWKHNFVGTEKYCIYTAQACCPGTYTTNGTNCFSVHIDTHADKAKCSSENSGI